MQRLTTIPAPRSTRAAARALALVIPLTLFGCADKAKPGYEGCLGAERSGDLDGAVGLCSAAAKVDPTSESGKLATAKVADIEQKKKAAAAVANEKARVGFGMWDGDSGTKDRPGAQKVFVETCGQGSPLGCTGLAIAFLDGVNGTGKDNKKAFALLQPACDVKIGRACSALGNMSADGEGLPKDESKAADLYKLACDAGEARGCHRLGIFYALGKGGLPKDETHAFALLKSACEAGRSDACHIAAVASHHGDGTPKSTADAVKYAQLACDGTHGDRSGDGCNFLAGFYFRGEGEPKDPKKAAALTKEACDLTSPSGCATYAAFLMRDAVPPDLKGAHEAAVKACEGSDANGCYMLATCEARGWGTERSPMTADTYMKKACDLGNATACKEFRR